MYIRVVKQSKVSYTYNKEMKSIKKYTAITNRQINRNR